MCRSCLSWYGRRVAPHLVHAGCSANAFSRMRQRIVPLAKGVVVEVGFGSGLNLPYYDPAKVTRLVAVDPDSTMLALAEPRIGTLRFEFERIQASGESIPLKDGFADAVVVSYALCTIPHPDVALAEIGRILKPGGRLIFLEHGRADAVWRRRVQGWLNRVWGGIAAGCNLTRSPVDLIGNARFRIHEVTQERFPPAFWLLGSHYAGVALKAPD